MKRTAIAILFILLAAYTADATVMRGMVARGVIYKVSEIFELVDSNGDELLDSAGVSICVEQ